MTNRTPWTDDENSALVALYFVMLDAVKNRTAYSKAALIREATGSGVDGQLVNFWAPLKDRSRGSTEFKLMNASAAHADINPEAETMHSHGYRALPNYQATLKQAMIAELERRQLDADIATAAANEQRAGA